ncbi:uncharacterized protein BO97DRAFT_426651 [Aspergillus homomorphus CBS 101889]|uniref:Uncharacterized protein n=1 Tax=Aspergillus homomorphus (strain CBS 101889) TaxID=1450537 RepID=A0A395HRC3_ASPHC|nr:hypothetical protein BO97DRAFT_426651 [Aspergillus homomorphus CBS 101889]RAL10126.1 hypothetical protein BO97DRAFT_426651 [Aspergillus homomorphus CBS 101889]
MFSYVGAPKSYLLGFEPMDRYHTRALDRPCIGFAILWSKTPTQPLTFASTGDPAKIRDTNNPGDAAASTHKPVASGLRSAIQHLRASGGGGFSFIGGMLLATRPVGWVRLVIADNSPRSPYRRMLGFKHWPRIAHAAALNSAVICMVFYLHHIAVRLAGLVVMSAFTVRHASAVLLRLLVFFDSVLSLVLFAVVSLPARAIFARIAASMLPEDNPIVPFERLFGGKLQPEIGESSSGFGDGTLRIRDAWATFNGMLAFAT